jgi:hypothetical protein
MLVCEQPGGQTLVIGVYETCHVHTLPAHSQGHVDVAYMSDPHAT